MVALMKPRDKLSLDPLMQTLGYTFQDLTLLRLALTHRSVSDDNNERLEFLGDSILNFVIADTLFTQAARAREGSLTRIRASLVKGDTLAVIARELGLGDYLILGTGELKSGGTSRDSILADALEAVIAAVYLDSGSITVCQQHILSWFQTRIPEALAKKVEKDPKTRLQELLQQRGIAVPIYEITAIAGEAHAQTFTVICRVAALEQTTLASGSSRRRAEQMAAELMLTTLGRA